jgi:hypothetical protein
MFYFRDHATNHRFVHVAFGCFTIKLKLKKEKNMKDPSLYRTKYLKFFFYNISSMCYLKRSIRYKTRGTAERSISDKKPPTSALNNLMSKPCLWIHWGSNFQNRRSLNREILGCDFLDLCVLTGGVYRTLSFRTDIVLRSMPQMFCC